MVTSKLERGLLLSVSQFDAADKRRSEGRKEENTHCHTAARHERRLHQSLLIVPTRTIMHVSMAAALQICLLEVLRSHEKL